LIKEFLHSLYLARLIKKLKPDVIHLLGLNVNWINQSRSLFKARHILGGHLNAPWLYSSWGTDLEYYASLSEKNKKEVVDVLKSCDYYIAESQKDANLAQEMGLNGKFAGIFPAFGGFPLENIDLYRQFGLSSSRKTIFLKGRDHAGISQVDRIGRAMTAMKAFALCQDDLSGYRIIIGQPSEAVAIEATILSATTSLNIKLVPSNIPHNSILRILGASRLVMALTINDGLPSILVEAMALGAFPIHSDLGSIREWIRNGENGFLVEPENPDMVAAAIRDALADDTLVDNAARINTQIVRDKLSDRAILSKVIELYKNIAQSSKEEQKY
jgi:glycosyltransferase involved in cell wall biosynthesis